MIYAMVWADPGGQPKQVRFLTSCGAPIQALLPKLLKPILLDQ